MENLTYYFNEASELAELSEKDLSMLQDLFDNGNEKLLDIFSEDEMKPSIICAVGIYYDQIKKDESKMLVYYEKAANKGSVSAMWNLGLYYRTNVKDYHLMKKWYKRAAEKGNISAHCNLGWYYLFKEENREKGLKHYKITLDSGNVAAMYGLGWYYSEKNKNIPLAITYYKMAAEQKDRISIEKLYKLYKEEILKSLKEKKVSEYLDDFIELCLQHSSILKDKKIDLLVMIQCLKIKQVEHENKLSIESLKSTLKNPQDISSLLYPHIPEEIFDIIHNYI